MDSCLDLWKSRRVWSYTVNPAPCRTVSLATPILRTEERISIHVFDYVPPYLALPKELRPHEQPIPAATRAGDPGPPTGATLLGSPLSFVLPFSNAPP